LGRKAQLCVPSVSALRELDRLQRPSRDGSSDGDGISKEAWVWDKVGRRGEFARLVSAFPHKAQKVDALAHLGRAFKARMLVENAGDRAPIPIPRYKQDRSPSTEATGIAPGRFSPPGNAKGSHGVQSAHSISGAEA